MTVVKDEACGLPEMLPVLLYDGMVEQRRVNWNEVPDTRVTGEYDVTGNVEGVPFAAHAKICVVEELPEAENLLLDVGWEDGLARWNVEKFRGCRCSTAVSGVCRSVPSSAGECGTRRSTEKTLRFRSARR